MARLERLSADGMVPDEDRDEVCPMGEPECETCAVCGGCECSGNLCSCGSVRRSLAVALREEWPNTFGDEFADTVAGVAIEHIDAADLQHHIDADHKVLIDLGVLAAAYKKVATDAIAGLEHISMDTDENRDLHARLTVGLTAALETANEQQRSMTDRIRADKEVNR